MTLLFGLLMLLAQDQTYRVKVVCDAGTVTPIAISLPWHGGARDIAINDPECTWIAAPTGGSEWIAFPNGQSGQGVGLLTISAPPNRGAQRRGVILIGGQQVVIIQKQGKR
jgi:hypothetical protein